MKIIGPDYLVFGVDDLEGCARYLEDFGLRRTVSDGSSMVFESLDGTGVVIRHRDDPALPPALATGTMLRQQVYGVATVEDLDAIDAELGQDRPVARLADGSLVTIDDLGFALRFQVSIRRPLDLPSEKVNAPGSPPARAPNETGVVPDQVPLPRTLSHVVLFVPDVGRATRFYERLGFRVTDELGGAGPFLRPAGTDDHHTLFFIQTPPFMQGCEHLAFHMGGPTDVLLAGTRFVEAGYQSFWGPGRHRFGSNWFWYFNSPFGCHFEYDADMDKHDANWAPRYAEASADASQIFLFTARERWFPSGPPAAGN